MHIKMMYDITAFKNIFESNSKIQQCQIADTSAPT